MSSHALQTSNHRLENWVHNNASVRVGSGGYLASDVGKVSYQQDNGSYWRLYAAAGDGTPTWASMGGHQSVFYQTTTVLPINTDGADGDFWRTSVNNDLFLKSGGVWYLLYPNAYRLQGVTINQTTPTAGQVLTAYFDTPTGTMRWGPSAATGGGGVSYVAVPAASTSTGTQGQRAVDTTSKFIYECTATNTWARYSYSGNFGTTTLTYVSTGDTNGLMYYAGTNYGLGSWTNPATAGYAQVGGYNASNVLATAGAGAVDRSATDDVGISVNAAGNYWMVTLPAGKAFNPNAIWIRARPAGSGTASNIASYKIQGSNDAAVWADIVTISGLAYATENEYKYNAFTAPGVFYRYIRLLWQSNVTASNSFFFLTDLELYGTLSF